MTTKTIFKSENGEVWHDGENYGTFKAGHHLCRDMAAEIERLRSQFEQLQEQTCELRLAILETSKITFEIKEHAEFRDDGEYENIRVKSGEQQQFHKASAMILNCCKKYLI